MFAIKVNSDGLLVWEETERPILGPGQVRIKVHATAINRADLMQAKGHYPAPPGASNILGLECSGEIIEVDESVDSLEIGEPVCALLAGGGYAQEVVVAAGQVLPIPNGLGIIEASAIPEVFATAYLNLYMEANLTPGERVLIHAGGSGVGTAAIQLCKVTHNPSFVTVGDDSKLEKCIRLGAEHGWNRRNGSFIEEVKGWGPVDVILDLVGASYFADNIEVLSVDGRINHVGLLGGGATNIDLTKLVMKRISLIGSTLRARSIARKSLIMDRLFHNFWNEFEKGSISPIVHDVIPISKAQHAHAVLATDRSFGKIILQVI